MRVERRACQRRVPGPCWAWTGAKNGHGYGIIRPDTSERHASPTTAHRASYLLHVGPIPEGLELDHLCGRRDCVNPAHLEAVTHAENLRRSPHANRAKTRCPSGHRYDAANTRVYVDQRGHRRRYCRACHRAGEQARASSRAA